MILLIFLLLEMLVDESRVIQYSNMNNLNSWHIIVRIYTYTGIYSTYKDYAYSRIQRMITQVWIRIHYDVCKSFKGIIHKYERSDSEDTLHAYDPSFI